MEQKKKTYYVEVASGLITQSSTSSPWNFKIQATDEEIIRLRELFEQNYSTDWQNFFRAYVPYVQYHYDRENDAQDRNLTNIYAALHQLGDAEAKKHIESMGILPI
ncbi:hydrolase [Bacillus sp. T33-2]|uniref:hydrolase n=1 Tax=Bacillus sp. T33-2 TaxID=2054168 RepID=UPI000C7572EC|nr:hydrolase [Bacillus sp. T33-2]PLR98243.1 hydrolase [Bacillus sp. T33-2]